MIIRAKTTDLFASENLTEAQRINSKQNKHEIKHNVPRLKSYPQRIVIELTSSCNIRCIMCGRNFAEFKPVFFDISWFVKIAPLLSHIEEVTLIGWGEPTLHPKFREVLEFLNNYPVRKFICTNGMLLDKYIDDIFKYKVDLLTISLDGSTAEKNNSIRAGSDFNRIINNAKKIVKHKAETDVSYPHMSTTSTIMKRNIADFPEIVRLAGEIGFNESKAIYLTSFGGELEEEALYNMKYEVQCAFTEAAEIAEEYGMKLKLPYLQGQDEAGDKNHKDCYAAWRDLFFSADGYVRPCMSTPIKLLKFQDYINFFDLWNAQELVAFRKGVNTEDMPESCKRCYQASYANWNKKHAFIQNEGDFSPEWRSS